MTFRDDHEAALARAEALEAEVKRQRAEADNATAKLAETEAERDRLRSEVKRLQNESEVSTERHRRSSERSIDGKPGPVVAVTVAALIAIGIIFIIAYVRSSPAPEAQPAVEPNHGPMRDCVVQTEPPGADVVYVIHVTMGRRVTVVFSSLGTTPITKSAFEWSLYVGAGPVASKLKEVANTHDEDHVELRLDGYQPIRLEHPCADVVHRFVRVTP